MIGRTIAHYEILESLGEGGMGVVYKARDTHLDRFVAIKVLPPHKVADPERKRRFVQEAKAASALNHPNIITIYDIDQSGGMDFISMEYVSSGWRSACGRPVSSSPRSPSRWPSRSPLLLLWLHAEPHHAVCADLLHRNPGGRRHRHRGEHQNSRQHYGAPRSSTASIAPSMADENGKPTSLKGYGEQECLVSLSPVF